jgi:two-component system KDP operon response regulator KdpE
MDLPDMSGKEVIAALREWSQVPIIIISSQNTDQNVIDGLDMGADDYVIKPFNADVLHARINAALRKAATLEAGEPEISNGLLRMDLVRHAVYINENLIPFTPKEYKLLHYFMLNQGKMLSHKRLLTEVWGPAHNMDTQYLRVFIGQLRQKIEGPNSPSPLIKTEMGIGYRMEISPVGHLTAIG